MSDVTNYRLKSVDIIQSAKKLLLYKSTAGVFVRLLRAINKLFLYQEVLKQNIGYYIILSTN